MSEDRIENNRIDARHMDEWFSGVTRTVAGSLLIARVACDDWRAVLLRDAGFIACITLVDVDGQCVPIERSPSMRRNACIAWAALRGFSITP